LHGNICHRCAPRRRDQECSGTLQRMAALASTSASSMQCHSSGRRPLLPLAAPRKRCVRRHGSGDARNNCASPGAASNNGNADCSASPGTRHHQLQQRANYDPRSRCPERGGVRLLQHFGTRSLAIGAAARDTGTCLVLQVPCKVPAGARRLSQRNLGGRSSPISRHYTSGREDRAGRSRKVEKHRPHRQRTSAPAIVEEAPEACQLLLLVC
jgi:hypothetical protein